MKKYISMTLVIFLALLVGFIAGCADKGKITAAENKNPPKSTTKMPASLKGVHSMPAVGTIDVAFSPEGGITQMIVDELNQAKKSIEVQAYSFTSAEIAKALADAHKRGVSVRVILDKSQETEQYSSATFLVNAGIAVHIDDDFKIAHSKIMIVDGIDVITGSFNFSKAAEHSNAENCLILHGNKPLVEQYKANWQWRWDATDPYSKKQ